MRGMTAAVPGCMELDSESLTAAFHGCGSAVRADFAPADAWSSPLRAPEAPRRRRPQPGDGDSAAGGRSGVIAAAQMHGIGAVSPSLLLPSMRERRGPPLASRRAPAPRDDDKALTVSGRLCDGCTTARARAHSPGDGARSHRARGPRGRGSLCLRGRCPVLGRVGRRTVRTSRWNDVRVRGGAVGRRFFGEAWCALVAAPGQWGLAAPSARRGKIQRLLVRWRC